MFLSHCIPLLDRSGLNVQGTFNDSHSTPVEDMPEVLFLVVRCVLQYSTQDRRDATPCNHSSFYDSCEDAIGACACAIFADGDQECNSP